ncbi:hypothetical protein GW916_06530 [bacterium]|nr:hypothetical protein [bacterium]
MTSTVSFAARPVPVSSKIFVSKDTKLWSEPNKFGVATALLKTGLPLKVVEYSSENSWVRVETPSGRTGWMPVTFTTQSSRRSLPANTKWADEEAGRNPASEGEPVGNSLTADQGQGDSSKTWELSLSPEYMNQITRENANGFGFHLLALQRLTSNGGIGPAISWHRFAKGATASGNSTNRTSHRLSIEALYRYRFSDFRMDLGIGYALDRSSVRTVDSSGALVPDSGGFTFNGSGSESSLSIRMTPRYIFPVSRGLKIGIHASYILDWGLGSGEGNFAGQDSAVSPPYHFLGGGMSLSMDL